ncbi:MAG: hypothetical protein Q9218_003249 [Villophora microphyllina]
MFRISNLGFSVLLLSRLAIAQATTTATPTTVSLWLPWLPAGNTEAIWASEINAQPNATTYLLSCPSSSPNISATNTSATNTTATSCSFGNPQTVTAGPSLVSASGVVSSTTQDYRCSLTGTTSATCHIDIEASNAVVGGQTGNLHDVMLSVYPEKSISFQPVTVTAGPTTAAPIATSAGGSGAGTSPTAGAKSGAASVAIGCWGGSLIAGIWLLAIAM